jgi:Flp pilus assembly protein TadD
MRGSRSIFIVLIAVLFAGCRAHGSLSDRSVARPVANQHLMPTIETRDPVLVAALIKLATRPDAVQHRRIAERYRELGIIDSAFDHFTSASQMDSTDAASYDALARIWRDWGFPQLGVSDALRATQAAPKWPIAYNTLGTLYAAMGLADRARAAYVSALSINAAADYAWNNLCYISFLQNEQTRAVAECTAALRVNPLLTAARNNLALAHAAAGRIEEGIEEFRAAGDKAAVLYNVGILHLARRDYASAAKSFEAAQRERPAWPIARERLRQARAAGAAGR